MIIYGKVRQESDNSFQSPKLNIMEDGGIWQHKKIIKQELVLMKIALELKMYLKHWQCTASVYLITRGMLKITFFLSEQEGTENGVSAFST